MFTNINTKHSFPVREQEIDQWWRECGIIQNEVLIEATSPQGYAVAEGNGLELGEVCLHISTGITCSY